MDDTLKDTAIAVVSVALLTGLLQQRAHHAVTYDLSRTLHGAPIQVQVAPRGLLGMLVGQCSVARISGTGFQSDELPFHIESGGGPRVHVRRLSLDFKEITLRGQSVRRFQADIPDVSLDLSRAFFDERIIIRSAGEGRAVTSIDANDLRAFIVRKYPQLKDVEVRLSLGLAMVRGETGVLGVKSLIEATGKLAVADSLRLNLVDTNVTLNGKPATPAFSELVLKAINPVLDIDKDLGLRGYVTIESVEIGEGIITLRGRAMIPRR